MFQNFKFVETLKLNQHFTLVVNFQGASEGFECDGDKPSILCLAPGYSTFDLPHRQQPNNIKIGEK